MSKEVEKAKELDEKAKDGVAGEHERHTGEKADCGVQFVTANEVQRRVAGADQQHKAGKEEQLPRVAQARRR